MGHLLITIKIGKILNIPKDSTIFIDLDEVSCDLKKAIFTFLEVPLDTELEGWGLFDEIKKCPIKAHESRINFFSSFSREQWGTLEPTPEFHSLLEWASQFKDIAFLSALPTVGNIEAAIGKRIWVEKHAPHIPLIISNEKHMFSEPNSVLIDDKIENARAFQNGAGRALLWEQSYNKHCKDLQFFDKNILT